MESISATALLSAGDFMVLGLDNGQLLAVTFRKPNLMPTTWNRVAVPFMDDEKRWSHQIEMVDITRYALSVGAMSMSLEAGYSQVQKAWYVKGINANPSFETFNIKSRRWSRRYERYCQLAWASGLSAVGYVEWLEGQIPPENRPEDAYSAGGKETK